MSAEQLAMKYIGSAERALHELHVRKDELRIDCDKIKEAVETLSGFAVGKPVVIEETFPLQCPMAEFERFVKDSRAVASGWIGFESMIL